MGCKLLYGIKSMYAGVLVYRVRRVSGGVFDDEQGGYIEGRGCVYQIFTL